LAWGRYRHDVTAIAALVIAVLVGIVPAEDAFTGFANPAVITVAAILVIGRTISATGILDSWIMRAESRLADPMALLLAVCAIGAGISAFMNNVGALAIMMPVAMTLAARQQISPSFVLMPLSFATLLGGMTTLIGTPPNLVMAQILTERTGTSLGLFSLAAVGVPLAVTGIIWLTVIGWRLLPARVASGTDRPLPELGSYQAEVWVSPGEALEGLGATELADRFGLKLHGIIRAGQHVFGLPSAFRFQGGDVLLIEGPAENLEHLVASGALRVPGAENSEEIIEAVVPPQSVVLGSTADSLRLVERYGVILVAASRQGRRFEGNLQQAPLASGDVIMLAGAAPALRQMTEELGLLRLEERSPTIRPINGLKALGAFAVAIIAVATGTVAPHIAFVATLLVLVFAGTLDLRSLYRRVDWSVVVLLAALIPMGEAFASTGAAERLASLAIDLGPEGSPRMMLLLILVLTVIVTPILNNVATVVVMAPLAVSVAQQMGVSATPFVVATAIAASTDFLTPFGHHNNTIVMGPGGYRFGDYWRVGLPLVLFTVLGSLLLIPLSFPFI
jgi:di/tricarboxylate transporter